MDDGSKESRLKIGQRVCHEAVLRVIAVNKGIG